MLALALASPDHEVGVPGAIEAVLAARLDQLGGGERDILEAAAVEGEVFHVGAVRALAPDETGLTRHLDSLLRKDVVRPAEPEIEGEEAFRFRHLLVRDAAYEALPKAARAELHERLATWVEERVGDAVDAAAITGYHLDRACGYRRELAPADERAIALAKRAADLAVAGRRAHLLGDMAATARLLARARELQPPEEREVDLEVDLGEALKWVGRPGEATAVLEDAEARAAARGDRAAELLARLAWAGVSWSRGPEGSPPMLRALAEEAIPVFEAKGLEAGLMRAWVAIAHVEHVHGCFEPRRRAFEHALVHARRAGDHRSIADITTQLAAGYVYGPAPVGEALDWLADQGLLLTRRPMLMSFQAMLEAMRGHIDEARSLLSDANARNEQLGARGPNALQAEAAWIVETHASNPAAAERALRAGCRALEEMGEPYFLATQAAELANTLCALGRYEEAEEWAGRSAKLALADDTFAQMLWRQALAKVVAHRGALEEAERLALEAVRLAKETDMLAATGDALVDLAAIMRCAGKLHNAAARARQALRLYGQKGNTVMTAKARRLCEQLEPQVARR